MDLTHLSGSAIDVLLDEIEEAEKPTNKIDSWIRSRWKIGSFVEIYANVSGSWFKGKITNISHHDEREWLEVKYSNKYNKIRSQQTPRDDVDAIRPFYKAMNIYRYIFNAINNNNNNYIKPPIPDINAAFTPEKTPLYSDLDDMSDADLNDQVDDDSDTPEPTDTPQPPHGIGININYEDQDMKLSDDSHDTLYSDDTAASYQPILSQSSRSCEYWQRQTMERIMVRGLTRTTSKIKCITPITQRAAEMKINNFYRRRSVATVDHTVHRLFKLDPDLLKIREEFLERMDQENDDSYDDSYADSDLDEM